MQAATTFTLVEYNFVACPHQGFGMKSAVGSTWNPGTGFFKKSKKRSETRFGPLLMSSGRLVLFSGESEHFFFRRKCGS